MIRKTVHRLLANLLPDRLFGLRKLKRISSLKEIYQTDQLFFVQLGANDGFLRDPLHHFIKKYHWKGILVEPVESYFHKLQQTYAGAKGLIFEKVAMSDSDAPRTIYKIKDHQNEVAKWFEGIASLDKAHLLKHRYAFPDIEEFIEAQSVRCMTLQQLLQKHGVKQIDLLCMDVEGHEPVILKQLPRLNLKPKVILYEHKHLKEDEAQACRTLLSELGYHFSQDLFGMDTLAFLR